MNLWQYVNKGDAMLIFTWQRCGHVIFIALCLTILGVQYMLPFNRYQDDRYSNNVPINHKPEPQTLQDSFSSETGLEYRVRECLPSRQIQNKEQPSLNTISSSLKKNTTQKMEEHVIEFDLTEFLFPEIEFMKSMLAGWDQEAEEFINEGDIERLVNFKTRISAGMSKETCVNFLKSDCAVSLLNSSFSTSVPNDGKSDYNYIQHYRASLEALHRLKDDDPYYFFGKSLLCLRYEKDPTKAMNVAQEGLVILRSRENITATDIYYDWLLTQITGICLSTSNRNEEAIKVITECKKRAEKLPGNERGLVKEMSAVIDSIQHGKTFSQMVSRKKLLINSN